jgi:hypothetical protein
MKRQIVQIAAMTEAATNLECVYALCDDGSVWGFAEYRDDAWRRLPPIPQDPEAPEVTELRKFVEGNGDDRP